jgi:hypothetical protein
LYQHESFDLLTEVEQVPDGGIVHVLQHQFSGKVVGVEGVSVEEGG